MDARLSALIDRIAARIGGKRVVVHYVGVAWSSGKEFDASWDRGSAFDFRLGAREVIEGWEKGVKGMREGGRRQITIPPHLGYGARGAGGVLELLLKRRMCFQCDVELRLRIEGGFTPGGHFLFVFFDNHTIDRAENGVQP